MEFINGPVQTLSMCINYKQALLTGVINYAVLFLIISGLMFAPGAYDQASKTWAVWTEPLIWVIGVALVYFIAQKFYFKAKPANWLKEGLALGLFVVAVSVVIEIPVMVYGFAASMGWNWFMQWTMWVGYVIGIAGCVLAAKMKK